MKIPWRRKWQPTPVFLPGKSHGQKSLAGSQRVRTWLKQLSTLSIQERPRTCHRASHQHQISCSISESTKPHVHASNPLVLTVFKTSSTGSYFIFSCLSFILGGFKFHHNNDSVHVHIANRFRDYSVRNGWIMLTITWLIRRNCQLHFPA